MTLLVRLRLLDGSYADLAVVDGRFADPDGVEITETLDARSLVCIAGLADAHAHLAARSIPELVEGPDRADLDLMRVNGRLNLAAGVLLAIDKGFKSDDGLRYLREPEGDRPDLDMAGSIISTPDGYYRGFGLQVAEEDLASAVAARAGTGATWVKIIADWPRKGRGTLPNFSQDVLEAAVEAAHAAGQRVAVHSMAPDAPSLAVRAGVDSIEHGLFLTDDDVAALGGRGGAWVPTVAAVELLIDMLGEESSGGRLLRRGLGRVRDLLPGAVGRGVRVLAGTDLSIPHGQVAREAERLVDYGLAPAQAVAAVTTSAYGYTGRPRPLAPGASADFVALDGDPREEITLLRRPRLVMRRGRLVIGSPG